LDDNQPFGSLAFQAIWTDTVQQHPNCTNHYDLPELMELGIQACQRKGIKIPPPFLRSKRMAEDHRLILIRLTSSEAESQTTESAPLAGQPLSNRKYQMALL